MVLSIPCQWAVDIGRNRIGCKHKDNVGKNDKHHQKSYHKPGYNIDNGKFRNHTKRRILIRISEIVFYF